VSVFINTGEVVKNRSDRVAILNGIAKAVIDGQRGKHPVYIFTYKDGRVGKMRRAAWCKARKRTGRDHVRVHDLKRTFARRLKAAGVSFENRQDLLRHKSNRVTTHYSAPELQNLIEAANKVCGKKSRKSPALVLLKRRAS